jgi:NAD(P)-dependent dehydrogenase (short-subunit alcohol dehydrogenase family)
MEHTENKTAIVVGASGAIGEAMVSRFMEDPSYKSVVAVSRQASVSAPGRLIWKQTDHSDASITDIAAQLGSLEPDVHRVVMCPGMLHGATIQPEKMLEHLDAAAMQRIFSVNVVIPALWLRSLTPLFKASEAVVAMLSARVGSITDNRAGGWYSYRSSKAALNMLMKSASIELRRRAPGVKLLAFHPGTTDSHLSQPFQRNVAPEKLFTPQFVAQRLSTIMDDSKCDGELDFVDWEGKTIPW